jgi:hypothetical protein
MYQLTTSNTIRLPLENGSVMFLPDRNNGTPEWQKYQAWLNAGNTPRPADPTPPPQPDYQLLYDSILGSSVYQLIRAAAVNSLPLTLACVEFIAAIGDAKAGRPNVPALQACIFNILQPSVISESQKALLRGYIKSANLDSTFAIP